VHSHLQRQATQQGLGIGLVLRTLKRDLHLHAAAFVAGTDIAHRDAGCAEQLAHSALGCARAKPVACELADRRGRQFGQRLDPIGNGRPLDRLPPQVRLQRWMKMSSWLRERLT